MFFSQSSKYVHEAEGDRASSFVHVYFLSCGFSSKSNSRWWQTSWHKSLLHNLHIFGRCEPDWFPMYSRSKWKLVVKELYALCAGLGIELLSKLKSINSKRFCIISDSALPWDSRQNKDTLGRGYAFYHMIRVAFVCCLSFPFVVLILLLRKRASAVALWYWAEWIWPNTR